MMKSIVTPLAKCSLTAHTVTTLVVDKITGESIDTPPPPPSPLLFKSHTDKSKLLHKLPVLKLSYFICSKLLRRKLESVENVKVLRPTRNLYGKSCTCALVALIAKLNRLMYLKLEAACPLYRG